MKDGLSWTITARNIVRTLILVSILAVLALALRHKGTNRMREYDELSQVHDQQFEPQRTETEATTVSYEAKHNCVTQEVVVL